MSINASQKKFLLEQLHKARQQKPKEYENSQDEVVPANVKAAWKAKEAAEKVLINYETERLKLREKRNIALQQDMDNVLQIIHFGDAKEALKALEKFKNTKY